MLRRRRRFKPMSANRILPNAVTVIAFGAGITAIRFAFEGRWEAALLAIYGAAVADGLDGRIARMLGATSKFGAELDSLSDCVAFGVAPAVTLYLWSLQPLAGFGWVAALFFATCCALRLARFNTSIGDPDAPPWHSRFFVGVPAPAGAGLVLLPLMLAQAWPVESVRVPYLVPALTALWLIAVGLLMVSRVPTYSFKRVRVPPALILPTLLGVGVLTAALISATWVTLTLIAVAYLASIPLSRRSWRWHLRLSTPAAPPGVGPAGPRPEASAAASLAEHRRERRAGGDA